jgi:hypothetical protein
MPTIYYDPWKSNESSIIYLATINGDDPKSKGEQKLEASESISVKLFTIDEKLL